MALAAVPIVFVHGVRTSGTMWRAQLAAARQVGLRATAIDLPGHGRHRDGPFTLEAARQLIDDAVAQVGGPVLLVGFSLGGYLAIDYAGCRPQRVAGLVAAGCCTSPQGPGLALFQAAADVVARLPDGGARLNAALERIMLSRQAAADVDAGGVALEVMPQVLRQVARLRPLATLARLTCPIWLVNGRWDHFRSQERDYLRACRDGRLVVLPGATHMVTFGAPEAFNRLVRLAAHRATPNPPAQTPQEAPSDHTIPSCTPNAGVPGSPRSAIGPHHP